MDPKIIVASHKKYQMPSDDMYLLVLVGSHSSDLKIYQRDDEGKNISEKNDIYCELTGLYWAYQNLSADYIGLNHYRRYFKYKDHVLRKEEAAVLLKDDMILLPKKRHYYIETVYSQFAHSHGRDALDKAKEVIDRYYPDYSGSFSSVMKRTSLHLYNMFIMPKAIFDDYCSFLFGVLFETEKMIDVTPRIMGYLGERLLDVYIDAKRIDYIELPVFNTERTNWPVKIFQFLLRKFRRSDSGLKI